MVQDTATVTMAD